MDISLTATLVFVLVVLIFGVIAPDKVSAIQSLWPVLQSRFGKPRSMQAINKLRGKEDFTFETDTLGFGLSKGQCAVFICKDDSTRRLYMNAFSGNKKRYASVNKGGIALSRAYRSNKVFFMSIDCKMHSSLNSILNRTSRDADLILYDITNYTSCPINEIRKLGKRIKYLNSRNKIVILGVQDPGIAQILKIHNRKAVDKYILSDDNGNMQVGDYGELNSQLFPLHFNAEKKRLFPDNHDKWFFTLLVVLPIIALCFGMNLFWKQHLRINDYNNEWHLYTFFWLHAGWALIMGLWLSWPFNSIAQTNWLLIIRGFRRKKIANEKKPESIVFSSNIIARIWIVFSLACWPTLIVAFYLHFWIIEGGINIRFLITWFFESVCIFTLMSVFVVADLVLKMLLRFLCAKISLFFRWLRCKLTSSIRTDVNSRTRKRIMLSMCESIVSTAIIAGLFYLIVYSLGKNEWSPKRLFENMYVSLFSPSINAPYPAVMGGVSLAIAGLAIWVIFILGLVLSRPSRNRFFRVKDAARTAITVSGSGNSCSFTMPTDSVTISVTYTERSYTITKTAPTNGTFKVPTTGSLGSTITISSITPATSYVIGTVSVTDATGAAVPVNGGGNSRTFTMPASSVTVRVMFTANSYNITKTTPINGTFTAPTTGSTGSTITISSITPDAGYTIGTVNVKMP